MKEEIAKRFQEIQSHICNNLEKLDGLAKFESDHWERPGGGGGHTRIIKNGNLLDKGGVNFSAVHGVLDERMAAHLKMKLRDFFATGVSIVLHPNNPHVPIIHMNIRYFEGGDGNYWFGGGIDLTPHYVIESQAIQFHEGLKAVCDKHDLNYYPKFKKWADDYFFIKHRNETRGIGGIFFDHLKADEHHRKEDLFGFVQDVGMAFYPLYEQQAKAGMNKAFSDEEREWQLIRRGRYVEFNLVYDRGTKFGLETNGRTESILMSLPTDARWMYDYQVEKGSREEETLNFLKRVPAWIS
jgi:coproporphyrinogen III oxidase